MSQFKQVHKVPQKPDRLMVVYKITFPNGKIYVGQDRINTLTYFGSMDSGFVERDFSREQQHDFSIRKAVLWESETASHKELNEKEIEFIYAYRSNNPAIGYNQRPKLSFLEEIRK
ncbi:GIY-YIG nuclease family protein [Bdellovibrionota bacterium FG-2]